MSEKMSKPIQGWCIKMPINDTDIGVAYYMPGNNLDEYETIEYFRTTFDAYKPWESYEARGYRCVKVRIEEV